MSCAAGDDCVISTSTPGQEVTAPNNHACRGQSEGLLHGVGGTQDPEGDNEMHRVCPPCSAAGSASKGKGKESPGGKRKRQGVGLFPEVVTKKKACQSSIRLRLTLNAKAQILDDLEDGASHATICKRYGCSLRVVSRCVSDKEKIRAVSSRPGEAGQMKSLRGLQHSEVGRRVLVLLEEAKKTGMPVTQDVVQMFGQKAKDMLLTSKDLSEHQKSNLEAFAPNQRWVQNFVKRNGLESKTLRGQKAGKVTSEKYFETGMQAVRDASESFNIENIFNVDETSLFYKLLPRRTYLASSGGRKTTRGSKDMEIKDRLSAYMCTNATGSAKVPLAIIGTSKSPCCFRRKPPPVKYFQQVNAWSDGVTFQQWWEDVFLPYARLHTHKPVLLIMEGSSSQGDMVDDRGQVTVVRYPPNCTGKYQPMDMGVMAETKVRYRAKLLEVRVGTIYNTEQLRQQAEKRRMPLGTAGLAEGHPANVLDAAEILHEAWQDVTETSIARCWVKADTLPPVMQSSLGQVAGRGVRYGNKDPAMQQLESAFTSLSDSVRLSTEEAVGGPADAELCEVLAELDITPGQAPTSTSMAAVKSWARIEDHEDVVTALRLDAQDDIVERVGLSELNTEGTKDGRSGACSDESEIENETKRGGGAPPPLSDLAVHFGQLEEYAEASSNVEACHALRKAKLAFIKAHADP